MLRKKPSVPRIRSVTILKDRFDSPRVQQSDLRSPKGSFSIGRIPFLQYFKIYTEPLLGQSQRSKQRRHTEMSYSRTHQNQSNGSDISDDSEPPFISCITRSRIFWGSCMILYLLITAFLLYALGDKDQRFLNWVFQKMGLGENEGEYVVFGIAVLIALLFLFLGAGSHWLRPRYLNEYRLNVRPGAFIRDIESGNPRTIGGQNNGYQQQSHDDM